MKYVDIAHGTCEDETRVIDGVAQRQTTGSNLYYSTVGVKKILPEHPNAVFYSFRHS